MGKVADVKLTWKRSPSADVSKVVVSLTNDGSVESVEFGPDVEEFMVVVKANSSFSFSIDSYDGDGQIATSVTYSFTLGDLEAPLPATDLKHTIIGIRDEAVPPP